MIARLNSLRTFERTLAPLGAIAQHRFVRWLAKPLTQALAWLNVRINGHRPQASLTALGQSWMTMMPPNDQKLFRIKEVTEKAAFAEIHLNCPLRGSGDAQACHALMNYDRSLMKAVGGQLEVLESQATSGKTFCRLAIRRAGGDQSECEP